MHRRLDLRLLARGKLAWARWSSRGLLSRTLRDRLQRSTTVLLEYARRHLLVAREVERLPFLLILVSFRRVSRVVAVLLLVLNVIERLVSQRVRQPGSVVHIIVVLSALERSRTTLEVIVALALLGRDALASRA